MFELPCIYRIIALRSPRGLSVNTVVCKYVYDVNNVILNNTMSATEYILELRSGEEIDNHHVEGKEGEGGGRII